MAITVNNENFVRAETDRMFANLQAAAGGVNRWQHLRALTAIDEQTGHSDEPRHPVQHGGCRHLARRNGDGPQAGDRYLSVMVVNEDHYINKIFHHPGAHTLSTAEFDTPYVLLAARVLVDSSDPNDIEWVNAIQDGFSVMAASNRPFVLPDYDENSFTAPARHSSKKDGRAGA